MRYLAFATDFDGTLAHNGRVDEAAIEALKSLKKSGRKVILVTGRLVESLENEFPNLELFDLVVAENGAVLYDARTRNAVALADPPQEQFISLLRERGVTPLEVGHVIVSTWEPYESAIVEIIRELGLERQVIFNKGAVMTLPSGVNKATGLAAALERFDLSAHNAVGIGDAENDHAFLQFCELSAAVANALPAVKEAADMVLEGDHGAGVAQLVHRLLEDDCQKCPSKRDRGIVLGSCGDQTYTLAPYSEGITLIAGGSGSGKSTLVTGIIERILSGGYQVCIIDPEGDYDAFDAVATVGDVNRVPTIEEVTSLLRRPEQSLAVNLLGVPVDARADLAEQLLPALAALRTQTGRPHWIVLDEAHHLVGKERNEGESLQARLFNVLAVTTRPALLSKEIRNAVSTVVALGSEAASVLQEVEPAAHATIQNLEDKQGAIWLRSAPDNVQTFDIAKPAADLTRHRRKYAAGDLAPEKSFYFRGKDDKLNLRAQNLNIFAQLAEGIDDETWLYHLRRGDVAAWFSEMIGDDELAEYARRAQPDDPASSRKTIVEEIHKRYTLSA